MNMNFRIAGLLALLLLLASGCKDKQDDPKLIREQVELNLGDASSKLKQLGRDGDSFFVKLSSSGAWSIGIHPAEARSWVKVIGDNTTGLTAVNGKSIGIEVRANTAAERRAMIVAKMGNVADTIRIVQQRGENPPSVPDDQDNGNDSGGDQGGDNDNGGDQGGGNDNGGDQGGGNDNGGETPNPGPTNPTIPEGEHIIGGELSLIEIPRLTGGTNNYFVTHKLSDGSVNYSYEYDITKGHSRWVAFSFTQKNSVARVGRSGDFRWDPKMPKEYEINTRLFQRWYPHSGNSGYDRGHLVASNDRRSTEEAEDQTFFFTNMSPQLSDFNQGYWQHLEKLVQGWGRNGSLRDVLYVAKGGSIGEGQYERQTGVRMVKPKYYWMAIVLQKGSSYKAIAFWMEHKKYGRGKSAQYNKLVRQHMLSIDELEHKTGLDLFHNLDDTLEQRVESEQPSTRDWPGLN